jgi:RNA polymerase sigma-70 factor, ECF subfamily
MNESDALAAEFETHRAHLRGVAYRMLGSLSEAEDAVQETWLRLSRADRGELDNLGGWLTTVIARVCLDVLRARKARHEESLEAGGPEVGANRGTVPDAADEASMADAVGLALMVVLETLTPAERIAFVLHDMFDLTFDEIAPVVGRSPAAARQLASRARRRVQGKKPQLSETTLAGQRQVVDAFLTAARAGDFDTLVSLLDPDIVFRGDGTTARLAGLTETLGATNVAKFFSGRAQAARSALVNGAVGVVVAPRGKLLLVLNVTIEDGRILAIDAVADPERLSAVDIGVLRAPQ